MSIILSNLEHVFICLVPFPVPSRFRIRSRIRFRIPDSGFPVFPYAMLSDPTVTFITRGKNARNRRTAYHYKLEVDWQP